MNEEGLRQAFEVCLALERLDRWVTNLVESVIDYDGTEKRAVNVTYAQLQCLACIDEWEDISLTAKLFHQQLHQIIQGDGE